MSTINKESSRDVIRERVIKDYLENHFTMYRLSKIYGHCQSTIKRWLLPYLEDEKELSLPDESISEEEQMKKDLAKENAELKKRIKDLEKQKSFLELQVLSRDMLIDIAEREGIQIRKKSGAK